jgi:acetyl esterase/lipase
VYDVPLCGVNFSVPPDDARVAINWVRDNAHSYVHQQYQSFNGQVVAIGTSAGGNLMYEAAAYADVEDKPDVVAAASGHPEIGYMSNGHTACADAYIPEEQANVCESGTEAYMGGSLGVGPYTGACQDNWTDASPACTIDADMPPTFIANGSNELVAFQAAQDFADNLDFFIGSANYQLCEVSSEGNEHLHGTQLLDPDVDCDSPYSGSVFDNMMAFIANNL